MNHSIPHDRALFLPGYPTILEKINKKATSPVDLNQMSWIIGHSVRGTGYSVSDIFSGKAAGDRQKHNSMDAAERLADILPRISCWLEVVIPADTSGIGNKKAINISAPMDTVPAEITEHYRKQFIADVEQEKIIADRWKNDPEGMRQSVNVLVGQLSKNKGFLAIKG
jgi:hypothetical protein